MTRKKQKSNLEKLMVDAINVKKQPLSIKEIVTDILRANPSVFMGGTPNKSLYSVIYKREKNRIKSNEEPLFIKLTGSEGVTYAINPRNGEIK